MRLVRPDPDGLSPPYSLRGAAGQAPLDAPWCTAGFPSLSAGGFAGATALSSRTARRLRARVLSDLPAV